MKYVFEIENLNFSYNNKCVFKNLCLQVKEGSFTTILGLNASGKTTLINILLGLTKGNCVVMYQGIPVSLSNLKIINKEVGYVLENYSSDFMAEVVFEEIVSGLDNITKVEIDDKVGYVIHKLKIKDIMEKPLIKLNNEEKWLVSLAKALVKKPKVLIIDNGFGALSFKRKNLVLKFLNELNKKGMTIIMTTSNSDEILYGNEIIILENKCVITSGGKEEIFKNIELLEGAGFGLPFIVSLSDKLRYYDLVSKIYFSDEKLVDDLWK